MNKNFDNILSELEQYIRKTPVGVIRQDLIKCGHGIIDDCEILHPLNCNDISGGDDNPIVN